MPAFGGAVVALPNLYGIGSTKIQQLSIKKGQ